MSCANNKPVAGVPKIIHLCWFSGEKYPAEIKRCLRSWRRHLPDYQIKVWTAEDARAIGCRFVDEALDRRKWAFAADVVRFYAVWRDGGVYIDSDVYLYGRFDRFVPERGFATFIELTRGVADLQAAFFIGEKGNEFCREMVDYYMNTPFVRPDGSLNLRVSPKVMADVAEKYGFVHEDREQHLANGVTVWPGRFLTPTNSDRRDPESFGRHTIYGSWRSRKFGRRLELRIKHIFVVVKYWLTGR